MVVGYSVVSIRNVVEPMWSVLSSMHGLFGFDMHVEFFSRDGRTMPQVVPLGLRHV